MNRRRQRRWFVGVLLAALALTGCSGTGGGQIDEETSGAGVGTETAQEALEGQSMGRYLEEELALPEEVTQMSAHPSVYLQKLEDGRLEVLEPFAGLYLSGDSGQTWERQDAPWLEELCEDASYIAHVALAPDGSAAAIYSPRDDEEEGQESQDQEEDTSYNPHYRYIGKDGTKKELTMPNPDEFVNLFWFGKDSSLYAYALDGKVYAVDTEDGSTKGLFETDGNADSICFTDQYMIVFASRGVSIYDLDQGMLTEDQVLNDFIMDSLMTGIGTNSDCYSVVAAQGEQEDVIYFAFDKGIYRHVIGGLAVEQVADGSLCSLGDPQMQLRGMEALPDDEFVILYLGGKLFHYTYHPEVPTVPEEQICVYSLYEDYAVRQAVSLYQKSHPEVYVEYEIGMGGSGGMSAEDAIKNLNTRMMSGEGPDVLILDGLPRSSYEQKGILADVSGIAEELVESQSLFPNLAEAFRKDGKIYELPVRFRIPVLCGPSKSIGTVEDLPSLADAVEGLRQENPEGSLTGLKLPEEVLYTLGLISSESWVGADGAIDQKALAQFLECSKRIYQAETSGIDPAELEEYRQSKGEEHISMDIMGEGHHYAHAWYGAVDIAMGEQKLGIGTMSGIGFDFSLIATLKNQMEDFDYALWQGQVKNAFVPKALAGICANSEAMELSEDFYRSLFMDELQGLDLVTGFPVSPGSFEKLRENQLNPGLEEAGSLCISGPDGDMFALESKWPNSEDFNRLEAMAKTVDQSCAGEAFIEETVCEVGQRVLSGAISVEDAIEEICKKAAIYLAE